MNLCGCVFLWCVCVCALKGSPYVFLQEKILSFLLTFYPHIPRVYSLWCYCPKWLLELQPLYLLSRHPDRGWETKAVSPSFSSGEYCLYAISVYLQLARIQSYGHTKVQGGGNVALGTFNWVKKFNWVALSVYFTKQTCVMKGIYRLPSFTNILIQQVLMGFGKLSG